ncbi:STAS domain-containing protein [Catenulispora yoronensis]|uniref:Anti-sigma factor antagonist n=1 Tax=Catenulispora yoronensis TaxID=450799 RepID=A0ABN2TRQ9_9ACTN
MKKTKTVATPPFAVKSWISGDGVTVFEVSGEVEFYTAPALRRELLQTTAGHSPLAVLDLSAVTFIDSSGVSALVLGCKRVRKHHGALGLANPSQHVRHVLGVMGLLKVFSIFDTVEEAQAGVKEAASLVGGAAARLCAGLS